MRSEKHQGKSLEREFAEWMKSELGYTTTKMRQPIKGRVAERGYEIDIKAERYSRVWDIAWRLGIFLVILSIATYLLPNEMQSVRQTMEKVVTNFDPALAGSAVFIIGIIAFIVAYLGKRKATTRAWVECKDTKSKVKRAQVQKLISSVQDVKENEAGAWKPDVVIMVSRCGFDADALNFANKEILCYEATEDGFELAD
jgi:hypothetical protein